MAITPSNKAYTIWESDNAAADFLQLSLPSGAIISWIDGQGKAQGALSGGGGGISFVSSVPATCTPGVTNAVQLSVAPFNIYVCTAANSWTPTVMSVPPNTPNGVPQLLTETPTA